MTDEFNYSETEDFERKQQEEAEQDRNELMELLNNKIGRKYLYNILLKGYLFTTTFTKSSKTFLNEGKREVALGIFNSILDLDPHIFARMCTEFRNGDENG